MSLLAATLSGTSNRNLSSEILLDTYTATLDRNILLQIRLSTIPANDQSITIRVEYTDASNVVLGSKVGYQIFPKWSSTNTTFGVPMMGPFWVRIGEKLKIYGTSTDATATAVSYRIDVLYAEGQMGGQINV